MVLGDSNFLPENNTSTGRQWGFDQKRCIYTGELWLTSLGLSSILLGFELHLDGVFFLQCETTGKSTCRKKADLDHHSE